jgi:RNA polymerase sigma-70 factor (ECF subfamily)
MDRNSQTSSTSAPNPETSRSQPLPDESLANYLLSDETARLVRRKARRLISGSGLPLTEGEEVAQALRSNLVQASKQFDPAIGDWLAFAERSLQYAVKNFKRHRYADRRHPQKCISLQVLVKVQDDGVCELSQLITADDQDARTGGRTIDLFEQADLKSDVAAFLSTLPPMLRDLADELTTATILDVSRQTGVPRSTLYDRARELRRLAENTGLARYLK